MTFKLLGLGVPRSPHGAAVHEKVNALRLEPLGKTGLHVRSLGTVPPFDHAEKIDFGVLDAQPLVPLMVDLLTRP